MITFAPGETRKTFSVVLLEDNVDEPSERFKVRLFKSENAEIARDVALGYIGAIGAPTISFEQVAVGHSETVTRYFTKVVIEGPPRDQPVKVMLATKEIEAAPGRDYYGMFQTLEIPPDKDFAYIMLNIIDDTESEALETFQIRLFNPGPGLELGNRPTQIVRITDND